jgi:hypothetical protein
VPVGFSRRSGADFVVGHSSALLRLRWCDHDRSRKLHRRGVRTRSRRTGPARDGENPSNSGPTRGRDSRAVRAGFGARDAATASADPAADRRICGFASRSGTCTFAADDTRTPGNDLARGDTAKYPGADACFAPDASVPAVGDADARSAVVADPASHVGNGAGHSSCSSDASGDAAHDRGGSFADGYAEHAAAVPKRAASEYTRRIDFRAATRIAGYVTDCAASCADRATRGSGSIGDADASADQSVPRK